MSSRKPPCRFFQQGNCRKGNQCPFPHVYENNNNRANSNRGNGGNGGFGPQSAESIHRQDVERFVDAKNLDSREKELRDALNCVPEIEVAIVTSSMGFGYPATENLISGRDYSFEESRWDFYQAQQQNAVPQYEQQLNVRAQDMKMCIDELLEDTQKAARYCQRAAKEKLADPSLTVRPFLSRPLDLTGANLAPQPTGAFGSQSFGSSNNTPNPFGAQASTNNTNPFGGMTAPTTGNVFGSQSLGGGTSSGFGTSSFGSASLGGSNNNTTSAFGTSGFGAASLGGSPGASTSPFGQSTFGAAKTSTTPAFGTSPLGASNANSSFGSSGFGTSGFGAKPATTGAPSGFGTSGFGASATSASPFGALGASQSTTTPAFGQSGTASTAAPFGQMSTSTFGQASTATTASPFGQTGTTNTTAAPFGSTGFGQTSNTTATTPAFGASAFGQQPTNTSPFGQTSSTASPFTTGFGSAFGGTGNNSKPSGNFQPLMKQSGMEPERVGVEELSDVVKRQFEANQFTLGLVPEIEPPLVYC